MIETEPYIGQEIRTDEERHALPVGTVLRGRYDALITRHENMWHTTAAHSELNGVVVELPSEGRRG